jgi:hypothetical protein
MACIFHDDTKHFSVHKKPYWTFNAFIKEEVNQATALFLSRKFKGNPQILPLYQCRLETLFYKVHTKSLKLSLFTTPALPSTRIQVIHLCKYLTPPILSFRCDDLSNPWQITGQAQHKMNEITCHMKYSLIFLLWLFNRARYETKFSILFILHGLNWLPWGWTTT